MSAFGPKRTCASALQESAFGAKADMEKLYSTFGKAGPPIKILHDSLPGVRLTHQRASYWVAPGNPGRNASQVAVSEERSSETRQGREKCSTSRGWSITSQHREPSAADESLRTIQGGGG